MSRRLTDTMWHDLLETRLRRPETIAARLAARSRRPLLDDSGHLFIVAADHPARGANGIPGAAMAMAACPAIEAVLTICPPSPWDLISGVKTSTP